MTLLETKLQDKLLLKDGVKSVVYRFSLVDKQPTVSVLHVENTEGVGLGEDVHVSEVGAADTQLHSGSGSGGGGSWGELGRGACAWRPTRHSKLLHFLKSQGVTITVREFSSESQVLEIKIQRLGSFCRFWDEGRKEVIVAVIAKNVGKRVRLQRRLYSRGHVAEQIIIGVIFVKTKDVLLCLAFVSGTF